MNELSRVSVVLPSLDPDEKLVAVIDGLLEYGFTDIILVNDGSKPENLHYFEDAAAAHPEIHLLHHEVNKGKGAALKNAFRWFLANRPNGAGVVTVDGDNQHHPEDTRACALRMMETGKLVLGVRDFTGDHVPARSRFGNHTTSAVFKIFVGMTVSDTQTGLRAITAEQLKTLVDVYGDRFEYETNMLLAMQQYSIPFEEVKIRTVYIEENKSSHFRAVRDSWRIYKLILAYFFKHRFLRFFKFSMSSLISAALDVGLFAILNKLLHNALHAAALTFVCTVGARAVSSLFNFFMNRRLVFQSRQKLGKALLRYYLLALPIMLGQSLLTEGAYRLLGIGETDILLRSVIYALVMGTLFIASYLIQKRWVFGKKTEV